MQDWSQNKKDYRVLCQGQKELPVFFQDWWLDVVCHRGDWQVCIARDKGGSVQGVLPFYQTKSYGFDVIKMPDLTPYLGIWLFYPAKVEKQEALHRFQKKVISELLDQLPRFAYYAQQHPPAIQNGLPFFWKGFKQTTRFSYRLETSKPIDQLFEQLKGSVRTEIRKAEAHVEIVESEEVKLFYALQQKSFDRQGIKVPYELRFLEQIDQALKTRQRRKILMAKDKDGQIHAAAYWLWDQQTMYNLLQGADPAFSASGAVKLLLWEGVQLAAEKHRDFDFEGGMMPNIEAVFSAFGGSLQPYFKMYKGGNLFFRLLSALKNG